MTFGKYLWQLDSYPVVFSFSRHIYHTLYLRNKLSDFDKGVTAQFCHFQNGTDRYKCNVTCIHCARSEGNIVAGNPVILIHEFGTHDAPGSPWKCLNFSSKTKWLLALIALYSDLKRGKSCGLWLMTAGIQLQIMCFCATSSKWC